MNKYIYIHNEPIYFILCSFNKLKLDKKDICLLSKIGYCPCCIKTLLDKTISEKELEYINGKDWDDFLNKYPMRLNQCNCTRCKCGINKILDSQYDLFDIKEKNPICILSCSKCNQLTIPIIDTKNKCRRIYSGIENRDINKNKRSKDELHVDKTFNNPFINIDKINIDKINNQLIYS